MCFFVILDRSIIQCSRNIYIDSDCIADYDMKLLDIDSDTLGIPEIEYKPRVSMASSGFTRIVSNLSQLGGGCPYRDQQGSRSVRQWGRASNDIVFFRQAEAVAISGGKITAAKQEPVDARWKRSEKEKKKVKKKNDVEMVDEDDVDSSSNQMTTKARKTVGIIFPRRVFDGGR